MSARPRPLFCGNWKLFGTQAESLALAEGVRAGTAGIMHAADVAVAPGFVALSAVAAASRGSGLKLAGQDGYWEEKGAFTGAVSMGQLADAGCSHVIVGHSERRQLFCETDVMVAKKTRAALAVNLVPIVCIGETLAERDAGRTLEVVGRQLDGALADLSPADAARCIIAYEPVWAIGTGRNATPAQAVEVHAFIRRLLARTLGDGAAHARILYGGSVKPDNVASLLGEPEINGVLVGGASLTVDSFVKLVKEGLAACTRS